MREKISGDLAAERFKQLLSDCPDLTYTQLGNLLGVSKQRAYKICQDYDIKKTPHDKGKCTKYDYWTAVKNVTSENLKYETYATIAKAYGFPLSNFTDFLRKHEDNVLVKKFVKLKLPKKADVIRKELKAGKLTPMQIATKYNVRSSYIYDIKNHRMED